ncbi:MAG: hypothetical protein FWE82_03490 [Defluviitaleaceae bacterium]|nr:hypothetical protein [Defluviitaleaceae bacterium]
MGKRREPNFERLNNALFCKATDAPPLAELFHDIEVMDGLAGREVNTTEDLINFYFNFGYDYVPVDCGKWFTGYRGAEFETNSARSLREGRRKRKIFTDDVKSHFHIDNLSDFKKYDWSHHDWLRGGGDLSYFDYIAEKLPQGMKLVAWSDGIYEIFPKFVGYDNFCYALYDDIKFIEEVFYSTGERAVEAYARVAAHPAVGAVWLADDIGYTEGLLWPPELMRKYLFPYYKRIGDAAKKNGKPFIFHSDGRLWEILPDLIEAGVNAIQPIEPKAWDAEKIIEKYGGRLCVMGTIDLDLLCRGTAFETIGMTKSHIKAYGSGGFAVGTTNTPTYYMKLENYRAMIDAANPEI